MSQLKCVEIRIRARQTKNVYAIISEASQYFTEVDQVTVVANRVGIYVVKPAVARSFASLRVSKGMFWSGSVVSILACRRRGGVCSCVVVASLVQSFLVPAGMRAVLNSVYHDVIASAWLRSATGADGAWPELGYWSCAANGRLGTVAPLFQIGPRRIGM